MLTLPIFFKEPTQVSKIYIKQVCRAWLVACGYLGCHV